MPNVQNITPCDTPFTTPEIGDTDPQQTLHLGPTGKVHKGGAVRPWAKRCALTLTPSPSSKLLFMVLASYVNGPDEAAWPSQSTLATMTGLTARGVRNATKQLEAAGRIRVERMGGDRGIRYWLEAEVSSPSRRKSVPVEAEVSSPEVRTNEGTSTREAAAEACISSTDTEKPKAETTTAETARQTCPTCGRSWPVRFGDQCHECNTSVLARPGSRLQTAYAARYWSAHPESGASPIPGKYDALEEVVKTTKPVTDLLRVLRPPPARAGETDGERRTRSGTPRSTRVSRPTRKFQRGDGS